MRGTAWHESVVIAVAYKGSGKKPGFQPYGNKKSGGPKKGAVEEALGSLFKSTSSRGSGRSKKQDSNKVHNTKGKNNHGRSRW